MLLFNGLGVLVDACYYNQLTACGDAVKHSGDSKDGAAEGYDEYLTIDTDALPREVRSHDT